MLHHSRCESAEAIEFAQSTAKTAPKHTMPDMPPPRANSDRHVEIVLDLFQSKAVSVLDSTMITFAVCIAIDQAASRDTVSATKNWKIGYAPSPFR